MRNIRLIFLALAVMLWLSWLASTSAAEPTRPELFLQTGHSSLICGVAYSPDGRTIATASRTFHV